MSIVKVTDNFVRSALQERLLTCPDTWLEELGKHDICNVYIERLASQATEQLAVLVFEPRDYIDSFLVNSDFIYRGDHPDVTDDEWRSIAEEASEDSLYNNTVCVCRIGVPR